LLEGEEAYKKPRVRKRAVKTAKKVNEKPS